MERLKSLVYGQAGQATSEYALTLLVVALLVGVFAVIIKSDLVSGWFANIIEGLVDRANVGK